MTPILLLHGALGSSTQLEPLQEALSGKGFTVHPLNFSGHSGEAFKDNFGIDCFANDVAIYLDKLRITSADIFGYSMGGYVALWLAHLHPARVNKIITLGTKFDWTPESAAKEIKKMDAQKIIEKIPAFARILETRHAPQDWKELLQKTAAMMERLGSTPLLTPDVFQAIVNHTLILLGDQDDMADREYSKQVAHMMPNARFKLLHHTPHPIERVNREELVNILEEQFSQKA